MNFRDQQRLDDIEAAINAINSHLKRGSLDDGLIFDALRIRLLEIGEAVKTISAEVRASEPTIPWRQIARMPDKLAHRYFDTNQAVLAATVFTELPELSAAITRILHRSAHQPLLDEQLLPR